MNKELIDMAWNCLPKEFKEEVKYYYQHTDSGSYAEDMLESIFGTHNLTSDAEGEEMLTVSRKKVQKFYKNVYECLQNAIKELGVRNMYTMEFKEICSSIKDLFGSKCLPDEVDSLENKLRFEIGNNVVFHPFKTDSFYDAKIIEIKEGEDKPYLLQCGDKQIWVYPIEVQSIAETYPPKEKICDNPLADKEGCKHRNNERCAFDNACYFKPLNPQETDRKFDTIIKDGFREHNRLHVASVLMAGLLASGKDKTPVKRALELTDALIAEIEKGGPK